MASRNSPSRAKVVEWMSEAARVAGWRRSGRVMWTRGPEYKVAIAIEPYTVGDFYRLDVRIFFDPAGSDVSESKADLSVIVAVARAVDIQPLKKVLDFDESNESEEARRDCVVDFLANTLAPLVLGIATRESLVKFIHQHKAEPHVPLKANNVLKVW